MNMWMRGGESTVRREEDDGGDDGGGDGGGGGMQEILEISDREQTVTRMRDKHSLIHQTWAHLSLVALLGTQTRSSGVKLLGNDAQELSLVLGSVAVRGAYVHHLEEERHACVERNTKERGTETV